MLPFILFLSSMWVFIKLKNNRDILSLKTFGYSNANFLIFCFVQTVYFIVTLFAVNPVNLYSCKILRRYKRDPTILINLIWRLLIQMVFG